MLDYAGATSSDCPCWLWIVHSAQASLHSRGLLVVHHCNQKIQFQRFNYVTTITRIRLAACLDEDDAAGVMRFTAVRWYLRPAFRITRRIVVIWFSGFLLRTSRACSSIILRRWSESSVYTADRQRTMVRDIMIIIGREVQIDLNWNLSRLLVGIGVV